MGEDVDPDSVSHTQIQTIAINPTVPRGTVIREQSPNKLDGTLSPFRRHAPDDPTVVAQLFGVHIDEV